MIVHFWLMIVFAAFVSAVFSLLIYEEPKEQVRFAVKVFGGFILVGIVLGWLMYPFPV